MIMQQPGIGGMGMYQPCKMDPYCIIEKRHQKARNMDNHFMHLTNYAINKFSSAYEGQSDGDEDSGHKRSLTDIMTLVARPSYTT